MLMATIEALAVQKAAALAAAAARKASGGGLPSPQDAAEKAALEAAKDAAVPKAEAAKTGEFGLFEEATILRFYFSVYVTDQNLEPVTGLEQDSFTIRHLWIPEGALLPFDADMKFMPVHNLSGVYRLSQNHPASPLGNAFGVSVKNRRPRTEGNSLTRTRSGAAIVAPEFDVGFGMATAARGE